MPFFNKRQKVYNYNHILGYVYKNIEVSYAQNNHLGENCVVVPKEHSLTNDRISANSFTKNSASLIKNLFIEIHKNQFIIFTVHFHFCTFWRLYKRSGG